MEPENVGIELKRQEVPNGWIVIVGMRHDDDVYVPGVVFVPDPKHEWVYENKREKPEVLSVQ